MNKKILGPNAPTTTNELGGKQSDTIYRMDLIDPHAVLAISGVLHDGFKKYGGDENWRRIPITDHLNHALVHIYAYLGGDRSDAHLSHVCCRAIFALAKELRPRYRMPRKVKKKGHK